MRLIQINISKAQLDNLPKDDRIFFVQLTHFLDELAILQKCLIFSGQTMKSAIEVQRTAQRVQSLFFIKMLAGKLNEGWEMLQKSFFAVKLSKRYYNFLPDEARMAIGELGKYFGRENLIRKLRNEYAFHYERDNIDKELDHITPEDVFTMLITESRGNSLSEFSDTIISSSILKLIDKNDIQKAMNGLYEEVISKADLFLDFGHHVVALIVDKFEPKPTSTEIDLQNVAIMEDVSLPFFIERRDRLSSQ